MAPVKDWVVGLDFCSCKSLSILDTYEERSRNFNEKWSKSASCCKSSRYGNVSRGIC